LSQRSHAQKDSNTGLEVLRTVCASTLEGLPNYSVRGVSHSEPQQLVDQLRIGNPDVYR
jgi:hypothetical protein